VHAPESDVDPYADEALLDPWSGYWELRDAGPAVWLPRYEMFALTPHAAVRSAYDVMTTDDLNQVLRGNTLCGDGVDHDGAAPYRDQAIAAARGQAAHR
jgi:hypothetical protein